MGTAEAARRAGAEGRESAIMVSFPSTVMVRVQGTCDWPCAVFNAGEAVLVTLGMALKGRAAR
jgi:hypothetical protein